MALTFTLVDTWDDGKRVHLSGTIAASGNYATGGDTLDLSQSPTASRAAQIPTLNTEGWGTQSTQPDAVTQDVNVAPPFSAACLPAPACPAGIRQAHPSVLRVGVGSDVILSEAKNLSSLSLQPQRGPSGRYAWPSG
jgi:hypothetical protein